MVALATFSTLATVGFSYGLASFIVAIFIERQPLENALPLLLLALGSGLARAAVLWLQEVLSVSAAISVKLQLRSKFYDAIEKLGSVWLAKRESGRLNLLATTQLDALDAYFAKYLPQLFYTAIITPVLGVIIFVNDVDSGWAMLLTLPLIPLFMVIIGLATSKAQSQQLESLSRMSQHFFEVLRALTTLRIFGRAEKQVESIEMIANEHRRRTMKVLRVSFLSGFALELIASLSVALIAVSIGLRLVDGSLGLQVGLFVLLLAPEAFLPLRMVGTNFHAAADGIEASKQILDIIEEAEAGGLAADSKVTSNLKLKAEKGKLIVVIGPSGAGKTTALRALSQNLGHDKVAYMPQNVQLLRHTVAANIGGPNAVAHPKWLLQSMLLAGLDDVPETLDLRGSQGSAGTSVSGGQAQRISLARAFYRALSHPGVETLLLDEPISALDPDHSKIVIKSLKKLAKDGFAVVAVSHQPIDGADVVVKFKTMANAGAANA